MNERNVTVEQDSGGAVATFSLVAVVVVVALIALFVWQPWNASVTTSTGETTVSQPAGATGTSSKTSGTP
jgi:hypothetical protein